MAVTPLNVKVTLHVTYVTAADRYSHLLPSLQRKGQAAPTLSTTSQRMYMGREDKFQRILNSTHTTALEWSTIISRSFHLEDRLDRLSPTASVDIQVGNNSSPCSESNPWFRTHKEQLYRLKPSLHHVIRNDKRRRDHTTFHNIPKFVQKLLTWQPF